MNKLSPNEKIIAFVCGGICLISFLAFCAVASEKSGKNTSAESKTEILANENYYPVLLEAIDEAQNEIIISIFSFKTSGRKNTYPDKILSRLAEAVKRGVKVIVILEKTDHPTGELDIQNRETGRLLAEKGINVFYDSPRRTTHTKLIVIDQRLLILGSHNFTQSALKYNNEMSVLLENPDMAKNAREYMLKIIREAK